MSEKEVVEELSRALQENVGAGWPEGVARKVITHMEAKGYTLTRRHGVVHEREGYVARDARTAGARRGGEGGNDLD